MNPLRPREYDRHGKRIVPLTKAVRAERRQQFRQAVGFYHALRLRTQPSTHQPTQI